MTCEGKNVLRGLLVNCRKLIVTPVLFPNGVSGEVGLPAG